MRRISAIAIGATALLGLAIPPASAGEQALSCKTSVGDTGGWAECTGSGTWRVKSVCSFADFDKYTQWVTTNKKTRVYATDCNFSIVDVVVQIK
ncbi:hypothetical protein [Streptomyces bikiniensis]|uniref:hypothetical protein n=1 Tax=Streptomyces bikiniensis TaxID=1896 RepID=UPI000525F25E|nr:hypothetical protein [Streptomyces bikiniensis]